MLPSLTSQKILLLSRPLACSSESTSWMTINTMLTTGVQIPGHLQKMLVYKILWFQCKPLLSIAISMMWMAPPNCMAMSKAQEFWHTPVPETNKTSATLLLIYPQMTNNSTLHSQHFSLFGQFSSLDILYLYWGKHFLAPPTPLVMGPAPSGYGAHTSPPRLDFFWIGLYRLHLFGPQFGVTNKNLLNLSMFGGYVYASRSKIMYIYMVHTYILYILAACYKLYSYSSIFVHCVFLVGGQGDEGHCYSIVWNL